MGQLIAISVLQKTLTAIGALVFILPAPWWVGTRPLLLSVTLLASWLVVIARPLNALMKVFVIAFVVMLSSLVSQRLALSLNSLVVLLLTAIVVVVADEWFHILLDPNHYVRWFYSLAYAFICALSVVTLDAFIKLYNIAHQQIVVTPLLWAELRSQESVNVIVVALVFLLLRLWREPTRDSLTVLSIVCGILTTHIHRLSVGQSDAIVDFVTIIIFSFITVVVTRLLYWTIRRAPNSLPSLLSR